MLEGLDLYELVGRVVAWIRDHKPADEPNTDVDEAEFELGKEEQRDDHYSADGEAVYKEGSERCRAQVVHAHECKPTVDDGVLISEAKGIQMPDVPLPHVGEDPKEGVGDDHERVDHHVPTGEEIDAGCF